MLWIEGGKKQHLRRGLKTMKATNISHERLSHRELKRHFPLFRLPDDCEGILEHEGYDMYASRCLHALQVNLIPYTCTPPPPAKAHDPTTALSHLFHTLSLC